METLDPVTDNNVEMALSAVLSDDKFAAAPQMSAFLKYVVTQTLYEDPSRIKAYTVAVDALGKPATFDPQNDPSVRVLAKRLRGSLDTYYENNPKVDIVIQMKAGSYVPQFIRRNIADNVGSEGIANTAPLPLPVAEEQASRALGEVTANSAAAALARATSTADRPDIERSPPAAEHTNVQMTDRQDQSNSIVSSPTADAGEPSQPIDENRSEQIPVPALLQNRTMAESSVTLMPGEQAPDTHSSAADHSDDIRIEQTPAVQVNHETVNKELPREPSILDRLRAIPRPAVVMGLCAGLIWFAMAGEQDSEKERRAESPLGAAMPFIGNTDPAVAESEYRSRPDKLTIVGIDLSADSILGRSIVDTVSTVVSRFDHVDLHRRQDMIAGSQRWPEDYQIHLHVAAVSGQSEINVQLIHAKSSRVAFSETLSLQSEINSELSDADYIKVQNVAARWMQSDGPILRDYDSNASSRTEEMACYIGVIAVDLHSDLHPVQDDSCGSLSLENASNTETGMVYRAWKMLTETADGEYTPSSTDRDLTLETAFKAVERSPYNGYAHISLAMAQNLVGDVDGSERSVENAMMLNPLDANILKHSASISEDNGDMEQATQWRTRAALLSLSPYTSP